MPLSRPDPPTVWRQGEPSLVVFRGDLAKSVGTEAMANTLHAASERIDLDPATRAKLNSYQVWLVA